MSCIKVPHFSKSPILGVWGQGIYRARHLGGSNKSKVDITAMNTETPITFQYQTGGSLSATDPTYVQRQADEDLYNLLKEGEFCYVLNSRQMGKSSLRVRTMQRLQNEEYACAEVDLSGIGSKLSEEKWYTGLVHRLMRSFSIPSEVNWRSWWNEHNYLSPVQRLGELFEEILLPSVPQNIVIFLDEIDSVLSFDFPTDDFFALIRYYYNQRVNNPNYNRLRFCLLGVATPSELIQDKQRTPFNIGRGVELTGLTEAEAIPVLSQGLALVVEHPEQLLTEVLYWTGGQPFLTQKLCRLIVHNSALTSSEVEMSILSNGNVTEGFARFVRSQIIENWESKDQPEHLKTIRDRVINRIEQRASYLLELYQKIWQKGEVTAKSTPEEAELQLSGLVVNRQGKLQVYNPIYREVFNDKWIEVELASLRPYSEAFRGWIASGEQDKSRLLRGKALEEAQKWAEGKELSYQDQQFLAASRQQKIREETEELEKQAQLERERKDKEAAEQRNILLAKAIRRNFIIFAITLLGTLAALSFSTWKVNNANRQVARVNELLDLASELADKGESDEAQEARSMAGLSWKLKEKQLQQALLLNIISLVYQYQAQPEDGELDEKKLKEADNAIQASINILETNKINDSVEKSQILVHAYFTRGQLHQIKQENQEATQYYQKATDILNLERMTLLTEGIPILTESEFQQPSEIDSLTLWEAAYLQYMKLLNESQQESVRTALISLQYENLEYLLNSKQWEDADLQTSRTIIVVAEQERDGYLFSSDLEGFSCPALRRLDNLWYEYSNGIYGFRRQKEIYVKIGNKYNGSFSWSQHFQHFIEFYIAVRWADMRGGEYVGRDWSELEWETARPVTRGHLPRALALHHVGDAEEVGGMGYEYLLSQCEL